MEKRWEGSLKEGNSEGIISIFKINLVLSHKWKNTGESI